MSDVRFVQVNHLHPDNSLHLAEFKVRRFDDVSQEAREAVEAEHRRGVAEALGYADSAQLPPAILRAYSTILGSMIHDIGNLHGMFGPPRAVLSAEIWRDGRLVGGVYGVRLGRVYFGESMFSRERDASKAALDGLVREGLRQGLALIDCQLPSAHLRSLGSRAIPRAEFLERLAQALDEERR